jgi:hypothetical protein
MNFSSSLSSSSSFFPSSSSPSVSFAALSSLSLQEVQRGAPAVFAEHAADINDPRYVFISTRDIVMALIEAVFERVSRSCFTRQIKKASVLAGGPKLRRRHKPHVLGWVLMKDQGPG